MDADNRKPLTPEQIQHLERLEDAIDVAESNLVIAKLDYGLSKTTPHEVVEKLIT